LFDRATQLWTKLEEDQQVQHWDQEEEKISATIQDLKQRQKMMKITEHLKGVQDMKKLQAELIVAQTQKKDRQAQMEPLQELAAEVIAQAEEAKKNMAQTQAECTEMIRRRSQCKCWMRSKKRPRRLKHKQGNSQTSSILSQELLKKHTKHRWLGTSHMSVLGACWTQTQSGEKAIFGKRSMKGRKDSWKEKQHVRGKHVRHTCKEDLMTLGLGFLQCIVMDDEPRI
jgi:hypothetical protein